jgi:hypothetical protein
MLRRRLLGKLLSNPIDGEPYQPCEALDQKEEGQDCADDKQE